MAEMQVGYGDPEPGSAGPPVRILYVDTETVWRGGQEQLFGLITGVRNAGMQVHLAAPAPSPLAGKARQLGIPVVNYRQRSEASPAALFRLLKILKHLPIDVLHFNTPTPVIPGGLAARRAGIPVAVCSRRVNFPLNSPFSVYKYNWLLDRVFTVSDSIRRTLIQAGVRENLVEVIYEGVDLAWIDRLSPPDIAVPAGRPVVGVVAHLSQEKGHSTLLAAVHRLVQDPACPEFQVLIVGDGKLRPLLESTVKRLGLSDRVWFTGFRTDSEALMRRFDIFCLPSLSEGLSSAILTAMASRLPVVSTDVGGIPELVQDHQTGFLVSPGDAEALAEALARLLSDPQRRRAYGHAGRKRIEDFFTIERKLEATLAAYRKLLAEKTVG